MARLLTALVIFLELAALAVIAMAVTLGRFDQGAAFFLALFGVIAIVATAAVFALPKGMGASVAVHGMLVFGSVIFVFPFVWLVGTSFKYPEEIVVYPPKWIPSTPHAVAQSPYVSAELYKPVERPAGMPRDRWERLWPAIEAALWARAVATLGPERPAGLHEIEVRAAVTQGLWQTVAAGMPANIWEQPDEALAAAFAGRVDEGRVDDVWTTVFRCVALRDPFITAVDRREHFLGDGSRTLLEAYAVPVGDVRLKRRPISLTAAESPPPLIMEYGFTQTRRAGITADLPLPVPESELLSITLPIRQDRSWHRLGFTLEFGGRRYVSRNALFLGHYRWQELTFKLSDRDSRDERDLGIWPLAPAPRHDGAFNAPGCMRMTLHVDRASLPAATLFKYTQSYRNAWNVGQYWRYYIFNSAYLVTLTVFGQVLSCSMVAFAFARLRWPGRDALFFLLLATLMLPGQVTMIPVFLIFRTLGWYNTLRPLWVPAFFGGAFFIFLLRQFMKGIPRELEEAARIDGCGYAAIYWRIILPLMKPALAAVGIFTFMGTWNEFMGPLIYLSDQRLFPLALGLFDFRAQHGGDFGILMAASTIMVLPVVVLFFFAQKYFIQGVTLTGMKN